MVRLAVYAAGSMALAVGVVAHSVATRKQFYPAVIYLATSKFSILVFGNLMFTLVTMLGKGAKSMFFGSLRDIEVEHMYDRSWTALVEMCIAMTIFREEFSVRFVGLVTVLFFLKIFHWLTQHRLEYIEQAYPQLPRSTHFRIMSLMVILMAIDSSFVYLSVTQTMKKGASVLLLFAFEYVVLLSMMLSLSIKYVIHIMDMRREGRWDNKGTYVFYLQLVTDLFQLFVYMIFFLIICAYYGLPFHIVRDLYVTYSNFKKRITQYLQYRRLTRLLQTFPDVGPEEIAEGDSTCIICRDEMSSAKKLPCGHFFHYHCLRTWLETSDSCPYCRQTIVAPRAAAGGVPPQGNAAVGGMAANAPMPDFQMPPAAAVPPAQAHAAAMRPVQQPVGGVAAGVQPVAGAMPGAVPGVMPGTMPGLVPGMMPGMMPGFAGATGLQAGIGAGAPALSEETLKVHVEWQIESLQHLLRQLENRAVMRRVKAEEEAADGKPSADEAQTGHAHED